MQFRTPRGNLLTAVERKTGLTLATGAGHARSPRPPPPASPTSSPAWPRVARRSITCDNGAAFAEHQEVGT